MRRSRRPKMRQAAHVGSLLDQMLKSLGLDERLQQTRALIIWDDVVGPQIAAHTKPNKLRDNVLEVCVDQPTWMQQLQLMKPQILKKLNAELGETPLRDIYLKRGKVTSRASVTTGRTLQWKTAVISAEDKQQVTGMLTGIDDPELRKELESLLIKQLQLSKVSRDGGN